MKRKILIKGGTKMKKLIAYVFTMLLLGTSVASAQEWQTDKEQLSDLYSGKAYSPYVRRTFPERPLWGDSHLHTQDSLDAFAMGTRNTIDDAYNFAKGKPIKKSTTGKIVQKKVAYDWCAVTDHAFMLGLLPNTLDPKNPLSKSEIGKLIASGKPENMDKAFLLMMTAGQAGHAPKGFDDLKAQRSAWERQKEVTNKHYEPGKFTVSARRNTPL